MARTKITPTALAVQGSITDPAGTSVSTGAGNGVYVAAADANPENTVIRLANAGGSAASVLIKAGTFPLAPSSGQGDLAVNVPAGATVWAGPFESARFAQSDGALAIDTNAAVTASVFKVNRH